MPASAHTDACRLAGKEIDFEGVDQRQQPLQQRKVDRVRVVGFDRGGIGEFHHPADDEPLPAW